MAKEQKINKSEETIVYFLDKNDLEIKDVIEFENYEYVIDEETNKKTIFKVMKKINAENGDIVILQRNANIDYIGMIEDIENEDGEKERKVSLEYISNIFNRKIILSNEKLMSTSGVEDFIAKEKNIISIYKDGNEVNFMNESSSIQNILLYVPRIIDAIKNGSIIIIDDIDKKFSKKLVNIIEELLLDKTINKNNTQLIATVSDKEYIGESEKVLWI